MSSATRWRQGARAQYDPSYDVWLDTSLVPQTAQEPFTLWTLPMRFPDVRGKPLNVFDLSIYKEFPVAERLKLQIRCDAQRGEVSVVRQP